MHGDSNACFTRNKLSKINVGCNIVIGNGLTRSFINLHFEATKARRAVRSGNYNPTQVSKVGFDASRSSPSALIIEVSNPKFINPNNCTFRQTIICGVNSLPLGVTHTDHDSAHIANAWVTDNFHNMITQLLNIREIEIQI